MAKELFRAVQTAEEKADLVLLEAQRAARELLKTAEAEITEHERAIALEHRAMYQSVMEEKRQSVLAKLAHDAPKAEREQDESLATAKSRLDAAAKLVFERVWNDGHR